jgi:acylphosphatase
MHRVAVRGRKREKGLRSMPGLWLYARVKTGGEANFLPESDRLCHIGRVNTVNRRQMRVIYSGQVQGVGFRYTVRTVATGFDVTGTVRNLPGGQVELIAEGARDELEAFRQAIRESGLDHFVRDEDVSWAEAAGEFRGFEIVR